MIKMYTMLTKPGIILGNVLTTSAGFVLASSSPLDGWRLLATVIGLALIVGSAGVFNNYVDRQSDQKMERTKGRALARGIKQTAQE